MTVYRFFLRPGNKSLSIHLSPDYPSESAWESVNNFHKYIALHDPIFAQVNGEVVPHKQYVLSQASLK